MNRQAVKPDPTKGPACFAPPLDDSKIEQFKALAESAEEPVRDAMTTLITMVEKFCETPESKLPGVELQTQYTQSPFRDAQGNPKAPPKIVPLEQAEVERIWDYVPWKHELDAMSQIFELVDKDAAERNSRLLQDWQIAISKGQSIPKPTLEPTPTRDAAFHLLWFGRELLLDREPMTNDKI